MSGQHWTERDVCAVLYAHFAGRWAVLTQVSVYDPHAEQVRRCDVLLWQPNERIAVEVKVTRADLAQDVRDPAKQAYWRQITHRHAYAVPPTLRDAARELVPGESGIIVAQPDGDRWPPAAFDRRCPKIPGKVTEDLPVRVTSGLLSRLSYAEARTKALLPHRSTDDPAELRAQIERLQDDLTVANNKIEQARTRADDWRRRYAAHEPPPCATCGHPIRPEHGRARTWGADWRHINPDHDQPCEDTRQLAKAQAVIDGDRFAYLVQVAPIWPQQTEATA